MLITIPDLLDATQIRAVCSVLRQNRFVDGKHSAGKHAAMHKHNQELDASADTVDALNDVVMTQLLRHPLYLQTALPARISAPIYARYTEGMGYGRHVDDALMGPPQGRYRSDISVTIFLNPPEEYDGGELCIETAQGESRYKLPAGHALLYPSTSLHSVEAVSAGERLVAVTWVQSHLRRADQREILVRLDRLRQSLARPGAEAELQQIDLCYANLFRMWADL